MRRVAMGMVLAGTPAMVLAAPAPMSRPKAFGVCAICHKTEKGAPQAMGPNLWGIGTRGPGKAVGYGYSAAMKGARFNWDRSTLIAFITAPQKQVPGTKMGFGGQKDPAQAAQIADYLLSLQ